MKPKEFKTFEEFWPFYVLQHLNVYNRYLHFAGTTGAFACLWLTASTSFWFIFLAPVCGYIFAWIGHLLFEGNKPATFKYPIYSLHGDLRMYNLMWLREMENETIRIRRANLGLIVNKERL